MVSHTVSPCTSTEMIFVSTRCRAPKLTFNPLLARGARGAGSSAMGRFGLCCLNQFSRHQLELGMVTGVRAKSIRGKRGSAAWGRLITPLVQSAALSLAAMGVRYSTTYLRQRHLSRYGPQYDGYCALGAAIETAAHKDTVDPEAWAIVDGKLYLVHSTYWLEQWRQRPRNSLGRPTRIGRLSRIFRTQRLLELPVLLPRRQIPSQ